MSDSDKPGFFSRLLGRTNTDRDGGDPTAGNPQADARAMSAASIAAREVRMRGQANPAPDKLPQFSRAASRDPGSARQASRLNRLREAFTPSHPIAQAQRFAGRRGLLEQLIHLIEDQQLHVVLYGDRGIGKTSLLRIVSNLARDAEYHVSYASCGSDTSFDSLFRQFAREIPLLFHKDYAPTHPEVEAGGTLATLIGDKPLTVADVTAVLEKVQGTRILLIIDEFDRVASARMREQIAEVIKNLSDRGSSIQFLIAGVASNLTALVAHIPSIRRNLIGVPVAPLDRRETAQVIEAGSRQSGLPFAPEAVSDITDLSRGLPYLAQLLGLHASFHAARRGGEAVNREDVVAAAAQAEEEIGLRLSDRILRAIDSAAERSGWPALRSIAERGMIGHGRLLANDVAGLDPTSKDALLEAESDAEGESWHFREEAAIPFVWLRASRAGQR